MNSSLLLERHCNSRSYVVHSGSDNVLPHQLLNDGLSSLQRREDYPVCEPLHHVKVRSTYKHIHANLWQHLMLDYQKNQIVLKRQSSTLDVLKSLGLRQDIQWALKDGVQGACEVAIVLVVYHSLRAHMGIICRAGCHQSLIACISGVQKPQEVGQPIEQTKAEHGENVLVTTR